MTPPRWAATEQSALVWRVGGGAGGNEFVLYGDDAGARAMAKADELNARRDERLAAMVPTAPGFYWAAYGGTGHPRVVEVAAVCGPTLYVFDGDDLDPLSEWTFLSGPLEPPPLPESGSTRTPAAADPTPVVRTNGLKDSGRGDA